MTEGVAGGIVDRAAATWRTATKPVRTGRAIAGSFETPVGTTPREEIWSLNKYRLYRYVPTVPAEDRYPIPVLFVYAIVNRPFILDLRDGYSFTQFMLDRGFDVYLIDWGAPGPEDAEVRMDDYGADYLPRVVRRVLADSGAEELSMLGYCFGSLIALLYAALYPDGPLRNLVTLTPPIDMAEREGSKFSTWLDPRWFNVDRFVDGTGNLQPRMIETGAKLLKAVANYVGAYVNLWDRIDDPQAVANWQAMHRWVHEGVPVPAEVFRQWVRDYLWQNAFVSGKHVVRGQTVDLRRVEVPVLNVLAKYDHIVPMAQSVPVADLVGSEDVYTEILRAGHIGIMAGRTAHEVAWPLLAEWLGARSGVPASAS